MNEIVFPKRDDTFTMECPYCKCPSIHHSKIEIFHRKDDECETEVITTKVEDDFSSNGLSIRIGKYPSENTYNPSQRRGGLTITFRCEHCNKKPKLHLAQHKGQTLLWEGKV